MAGAGALTLNQLADLPLCLAEPSRYFRRYLDEHFRAAGVMPHITLESASIFQLLQGVFTGLGCGIMPRGQLLPGMTPDLRTRTLDLPAMTRQSAIVIAETGRATPLATTVFGFARLWLAKRAERAATSCVQCNRGAPPLD